MSLPRSLGCTKYLPSSTSWPRHVSPPTLHAARKESLPFLLGPVFSFFFSLRPCVAVGAALRPRGSAAIDTVLEYLPTLLLL